MINNIATYWLIDLGEILARIVMHHMNDKFHRYTEGYHHHAVEPQCCGKPNSQQQPQWLLH